MISIITPVLNEKQEIKTFLKHLNNQDGNFELILVDGGSTDGTCEEIKKHRKLFDKQLTILHTTSGRAHSMNIGGQSAHGEILLFLHVDSTLEHGTLPAIQKTINTQDIIGGGLIQAFSNPDTFLQLTSNFGNFRIQLTHIFFGDCGIFVKTDIFNKLGGYDNIPFLEDVEFCKKAKKYGTLRQLPKTITTSPRRYHQYGKIKITIIFSLVYLLNEIGLRPRFFRQYLCAKGDSEIL